MPATQPQHPASKFEFGQYVYNTTKTNLIGFLELHSIPNHFAGPESDGVMAMATTFAQTTKSLSTNAGKLTTYGVISSQDFFTRSR